MVAVSENRERRRQVRQGAILDINSASSEWISAAAEYFGYARHYIQKGAEGQSPWSLERMEASSRATATLDRALMAAHMTCTDFEIQGQLTRSGVILRNFLTLLAGPYPEDQSANLQRISQLPAEGLEMLQEFNANMKKLVERGYRKYGYRRSLVFKLRRKIAGPLG